MAVLPRLDPASRLSTGSFSFPSYPYHNQRAKIPTVSLRCPTLQPSTIQDIQRQKNGAGAPVIASFATTMLSGQQQTRFSQGTPPLEITLLRSVHLALPHHPLLILPSENENRQVIPCCPIALLRPTKGGRSPLAVRSILILLRHSNPPQGRLSTPRLHHCRATH